MRCLSLTFRGILGFFGGGLSSPLKNHHQGYISSAAPELLTVRYQKTAVVLGSSLVGLCAIVNVNEYMAQLQSERMSMAILCLEVDLYNMYENELR